MKKLPIFLKRYFWDVEFEKLNPQRCKIYVLSADTKAILALLEKSKIIQKAYLA